MKYLEKLKVFTGKAIWDDTKAYYVPEDCDTTLSGQKWYGLVDGTFRYPNGWIREHRVKLNLKKTKKPFLFGKCFRENFDVSFLCDTHEENSQLFFGCKGWGDLLTVQFIETNFRHVETLRQNWTMLRQAGFLKLDFIALQKQDLIRRDPNMLIDLKQHNLLCDLDLLDIIRWLKSLNLSVAEAKTLWASSLAGKKITVFYGGRAFDYRSKTAKKNLHDFLSAVVMSVERKLMDLTLMTGLPECTLNVPPGFAPITREQELITVSKRHGWCAGQKYYRDGARKGEWVFFYSAEKKALAQYRNSGELMQVRGNHNSIYADTVPSKLTIK